MSDKLIIFDTTLRDGEQSPGASMTRDEKVRIARQLERLKVDVIEAGFAASSNGDFEAVQLVANTIAECRAQGKDVSVCGEMAGDTSLTRLLLGLGLRSFSMHPAQILAVKQEVLRSDAGKLVPWAQRVLESEDPAQLMVRA